MIDELKSEKEFLKLLSRLKWKIAVPSSYKDLKRIKGMIIGKEEYIKDKLSQVDEPHEILDPSE